MKQRGLLVFFILSIFYPAFSQNVGIGNTNPATSLDIKGATRTRPDTIVVSQQYQQIDVSNTGFLRLYGDLTGVPQGNDPFTILLTPGKDGQQLRMESIGSNGTQQFSKLISGSYLSNGKRILLSNNTDFVFSTKGNYIDLFYSDVTGWTETGRNNYAPSVNKQVFTSQGSFTVPIGVSQLNFAVWGAGGAGGGGNGQGGNGGFVAGTIAVNYGQYFTIIVAGTAASGGDFSSIAVGSGPTSTTHIILAAGGGSGSENGGYGGNAGVTGANGTLGVGGSGGAGSGAQQFAGGAGGVAGTGIGGGQAGTSGGFLSAGNCASLNTAEGEGGRGYYGGGGSGTYVDFPQTPASGGGGGGKNFISGYPVVTTHNTHTGQIIPAHILYDNGGKGGVGSNNGSAGKVVITW